MGEQKEQQKEVGRPHLLFYALQSVKRERDGYQRSWTLKDGAFCP
jgi:hypothetical protein